MPITLTNSKEQQSEEAAKVIQSAYRTYKYYQQILQRERLAPGSWILSNYESLKAIRNDYYCRFFMVRLVGFFSDTEIKPNGNVLLPGYERMHAYTLQQSSLPQDQIPPGKNHLIVNASRVVEDKIKFFSQQDIKTHPITSTDPYTRLYYVLSPPAVLFTPLQNQIEPAKTLDLYPSLYQLLKFQFPAISTPMTQSILPDIKQSPAFKKIRKQKNKHLIYKFLVDTIENLPAFNQQDVFMCQLLEKIIAHLNVIALYDNHKTHYSRISQLYVLTMSFIFVALAYEAPYTVDDYRRALDLKQISRLSLRPNIQMFHYPTKSSVDALMTSIMAEQRLSNGCQVEFIGITDLIDRDIAAPVWHEAHRIILEMQKSPHSELNKKRTRSECAGASHIFITGVTSEHQLAHFKTSANFHQGICKIKEACQQLHPNDYITLIIDETIAYEAEEDPSVQFIKALENELLSGSLNIMMCKSFQKFSSLGTSKVKLGNLTIINNGAPKFTPVKAYFDANLDTSVHESRDELQMVTHHLRYNTSNEILFVQEIRKRAKIIKTCFFRDRHDIINSDLFLHDVNKAVTVDLPLVDNYGFLFSSTVEIGRWSIGLEPLEMLCNLFCLTTPSRDEEGLSDCEVVLSPVDPDFDRLNNLAHTNCFVAHFELPPPAVQEFLMLDEIANGEEIGADSLLVASTEPPPKCSRNETYLVPIQLNVHSANAHEEINSPALISAPARSTSLQFFQDFGITEMQAQHSSTPSI